MSEEEKQLEPGDVVTVKSGDSPAMVLIRYLSDGRAQCEYWDETKNGNRTVKVQRTALESVEHFRERMMKYESISNQRFIHLPDQVPADHTLVVAFADLNMKKKFIERMFTEQAGGNIIHGADGGPTLQ